MYCIQTPAFHSRPLQCYESVILNKYESLVSFIYMKNAGVFFIGQAVIKHIV